MDHKLTYEAIPTKRQTEIWEKSLSFYTRANIFNNLRLNIAKIEKIQNVLPPSKTFIFIVTLLLYFFIRLFK